MGNRDVAEQLEAAIEEVGRLEREVAEYVEITDRQSILLRGVARGLKGPPPELVMWSHHDLPELAAQVTAQVAILRAEKDSPHADAKYWGELQEARNEISRLNGQTYPVDPPAWIVAERDAALAVIEEVRAWNMLLNGRPRYRECDEILANSPVDALAEHDRAVVESAVVDYVNRKEVARVKVEFTNQPFFDGVLRAAKAEALEEARDKMMPPLNWNINPRTGNEYPGASHVDEVYHDVHREMTEMAAEIRKAGS